LERGKVRLVHGRDGVVLFASSSMASWTGYLTCGGGGAAALAFVFLGRAEMLVAAPVK
jgi:hypothetical protein